MGKVNPRTETDQDQPSPEVIDELEQLRRAIEGQIRSNNQFLKTFFDENCADEEE